MIVGRIVFENGQRVYKAVSTEEASRPVMKRPAVDFINREAVVAVRRLTSTRTYAELEVSKAAYDEIAEYLKAASYYSCFMEDGALDMHGIALIRRE